MQMVIKLQMKIVAVLRFVLLTVSNVFDRFDHYALLMEGIYLGIVSVFYSSGMLFMCEDFLARYFLLPSDI